MPGKTYPDASSTILARALTDSGASPSSRVSKEEDEERLRLALERMKPIDREILVLHYFERLTLRECAQVLEISASAAKMRHLKAPERLQDALAARGGRPG